MTATEAEHGRSLNTSVPQALRTFISTSVPFLCGGNRGEVGLACALLGRGWWKRLLNRQISTVKLRRGVAKRACRGSASVRQVKYTRDGDVKAGSSATTKIRRAWY